MPRNLIIIQARMSSSRLPGKVLKPLWKGKNLLDLQLEQLKKLNIPFVLATTINPSDDAIADWAVQNKVDVFRGHEENVLKRFIDCAKTYDADKLIRVCSDNPFIQLDQVPYFLKALEEGFEYISYCNNSGTPAIKTHWGLFIEGVKLTTLERASEALENHPEKKFYSEHVTNFIYGNPDIFKVQLDRAPENIISRNDLRFTIDTDADFSNMMELLELLHGKPKNLEQLISITDENSNILITMQKGIKAFSK